MICFVVPLHPRRLTVKYWKLTASAFNVYFSGACRLFTGIITHGRAEQSMVGKVGHKRDLSYPTVLKLTYPYPIIRSNSCKSSTGARIVYGKCAGSQLQVFYRKIYSISFFFFFFFFVVSLLYFCFVRTVFVGVFFCDVVSCHSNLSRCLWRAVIQDWILSQGIPIYKDNAMSWFTVIK